MENKEFFESVKNTNIYKILKPLNGELSYCQIGDKYTSDILYERGYNIIELVENGYLELVPKIFPFEHEIIDKNIHSVITVCGECGINGINLPLQKECGNCGYPYTKTYYDSETIQNYLNDKR